MNNKRTLRRRMTVSQIIGLLMMIAGFAIIFTTGISAAKHGDHVLTESESEYMDQADTDEEIDLLEKWIYTKDQTRKAAVLPLMLLSGFLIVGGAPLFYTPIAVAAHQSRMSRREDAEERKARNRSDRASRKLDKELEKAQEEAERQAEQFRLEEKKKWERTHMTVLRDKTGSETAAPMQEVYFNDAPVTSTVPVTTSSDDETLVKNEILKRSGKRNKAAADKNQTAKPAPEKAAEKTRKPVKAASEKPVKAVMPAAELPKAAAEKRADKILSNVFGFYDSEKQIKEANANEAQAYFEKYAGKSAKTPELEKKDLAYLNVMTAASAEVEKRYEDLRKKRAENWILTETGENSADQTAKEVSAEQAVRKAPAQANKPKSGGSKPKNGSKGKKKNKRKKGGKRRKHLLF